MRSLSTQILRDPIDYDGQQLAPHWIYRRTEVLGDALVAFIGKADVSLEHMVDLEDVRAKAPIYSPKMLHFLGEFFDDRLESGIYLQHLFTGMIYECLLEQRLSQLHRRGNDIYFEGRKLSVSIATKSLTSVLIHVGINVETEGTPVPTSGLKELGIEPFAFAEELFSRFQRDWNIWAKARVKVLPRP